MDIAGRESSEINAGTQAIEDAVSDLKAINPNAKTDEDTRTTAQLPEIIAAKNKEPRGIPRRLAVARG